jgi:hypothetical protein
MFGGARAGFLALPGFLGASRDRGAVGAQVNERAERAQGQNCGAAATNHKTEQTRGPNACFVPGSPHVPAGGGFGFCRFLRVRGFPVRLAGTPAPTSGTIEYSNVPGWWYPSEQAAGFFEKPESVGRTTLGHQCHEPNALLNLQVGKKEKEKKTLLPSSPRQPCVHGRCSCPRALRPGSAGPTRALVMARCRAVRAARVPLRRARPSEAPCHRLGRPHVVAVWPLSAPREALRGRPVAPPGRGAHLRGDCDRLRPRGGASAVRGAWRLGARSSRLGPRLTGAREAPGVLLFGLLPRARRRTGGGGRGSCTGLVGHLGRA